MSSGEIVVDRGGSQSDLRRYNERIMLTALSRHPGLFNAELARRTGLAAQTISVILKSLEQQGLIARGPVLRGRRGQPATPLFLNPGGAYGVGVALSWRRVMISICDFSGETIAEDNQWHAVPQFDAMIETIASTVANLTAAQPQVTPDRIVGVGLALPNGFDSYLAMLHGPEDIVRDWVERDFSAELSARLGLEVWPIGYGDAASGAESRDGETSGGDFAYFFLGSLLMSGIVAGNEGRKGTSLGGMLVPGPGGTSVRADAIVSAFGMLDVMRNAGLSDPGHIGSDWDWHPFAPVLDTWLDMASRALAHVIFNTRCAFDIDAVVVDGYLPRDLMAALVARLQPALAALPVIAGQTPSVRQGTLGSRAAMLGAARLPLERRFFNTDPIP